MNFLKNITKNHIHEDNSPENLIEICVKCHKRHHFESGYDTVILKKNEVKPRTLEDEMVAIDREEFLKVYRERQSGIFKDKMGTTKESEEDLIKWVRNNDDREIFSGIAKDHSFGAGYNRTKTDKKEG